MNASEVHVTYRGETHAAPAGTTVETFLRSIDGRIPNTVLGALVNRRQVMLDFPLRGHVQLEPVVYGSRQGELIYKRSTTLMMFEACLELYPDTRLIIGQSMGNSYHFQVRGNSANLEDMSRALENKMRELRDEKRRFVRNTITLEEAEDLFDRTEQPEKLALLATHRRSTIDVVTCGRFVDIAHFPCAPHTGCLRTFALAPYGDGLLLRFPRRSSRSQLPKLREKPLLFRSYMETRRWQELLDVNNVAQLNKICLDGNIGRLVRIAEALHEKKTAEIADEISERRDKVRVVLVAGPSASGKTTFVKRLAVQLRVNGLTPVALSLDNYYIDREKTPLQQNGSPDYESIEALDLPLFHEQLASLLDGEIVMTPRYDFIVGTRKPQAKWAPLQLRDDEILMIEGIHGLNDRLTESVRRDQRFEIYISALTQLAIDDNTRIFTADSRLIRRLVRDHLFRGFTVERTLELWESVRRGEARWIFPFQEAADVMFNSALVYEPAVLKIFAERFLLQVPRTSPLYPEAYRLLKFLALFVPVFPDEVPQTSILREFVGGSAFEY